MRAIPKLLDITTMINMIISLSLLLSVYYEVGSN